MPRLKKFLLTAKLSIIIFTAVFTTLRWWSISNSWQRFMVVMPRLKKFLLTAKLSIIIFTAVFTTLRWWSISNAWQRTSVDATSRRRFHRFNAEKSFNTSAPTKYLLKQTFDVNKVSFKTKAVGLVSQSSITDTGPQCPLNDVCISAKTFKWRMFIFAKSSVNNILRRTNIRSTWGAVKYVDGGQFSTIFVIGKTKDAKTQALVNEEMDRFADILQMDKNDNYSHIVYKTITGMKWASEHLNNTDYYSSCDDDIMVNLAKLQENIEKYNKEKIKKTWPEFPLICSYQLAIGWTPIRDKKHKNYVSLKEYRWPEWPKFCLGGMFTTSVSVVKKLYEVSTAVLEPLRTDDVWITGVLRNIIGMPESMVVFPKPTIAQHMVYGRHEGERATKIFHNRWKNNFNQLRAKTICKC